MKVTIVLFEIIYKRTTKYCSVKCLKTTIVAVARLIDRSFASILLVKIKLLQQRHKNKSQKL